MRKAILALAAVPVLVATPAWACGGLVAPNGAVDLVDTTTLAAYHDGVEHYVTSFAFGDAVGEFGSIIPLPGVPTKVQKGGEWTLQRLVQEVTPVVAFAGAVEDSAAPTAFRSVQVIQRKKVGALDTVVLRGGGRAVARWAGDHGFDLPDDAGDVLQFYSRRSPVFLAARFDAERAARQGLGAGDGTPIHLTIPTDDPWVPLHILSLGTPGGEIVKADVFLLTDHEPAVIPASTVFNRGDLFVEESRPAGNLLLTDLASDRGMGWLPRSGMWFTYLKLNARASDLTYDLAVDASGNGSPSLEDAGFVLPQPDAGTASRAVPLWILGALLAALAGVVVAERRTATPR